jgi:hypothetical protein
MSTNHSPFFLSQQEIFLQLSAVQVFGLLLQDIAGSFVTLKVVYIKLPFVGYIGFDYKNPSDIES